MKYTLDITPVSWKSSFILAVTWKKIMLKHKLFWEVMKIFQQCISFTNIGGMIMKSIVHIYVISICNNSCWAFFIFQVIVTTQPVNLTPISGILGVNKSILIQKQGFSKFRLDESGFLQYRIWIFQIF